jgi:hypothetical protein
MAEDLVMIEDGIACLLVQEKVLKRDGIAFAAGESPDHKPKILGRQLVPTVRLEHRKLIAWIMPTAQREWDSKPGFPLEADGEIDEIVRSVVAEGAGFPRTGGVAIAGADRLPFLAFEGEPGAGEDVIGFLGIFLDDRAEMGAGGEPIDGDGTELAVGAFADEKTGPGIALPSADGSGVEFFRSGGVGDHFLGAGRMVPISVKM